jgi:hypothetical protein
LAVVTTFGSYYLLRRGLYLYGHVSHWHDAPTKIESLPPPRLVVAVEHTHEMQQSVQPMW